MKLSKFWAQPFNPVLPTVFSDDLSYYEFVKKIFLEVQEFEKSFEGVFEEIENEFSKVYSYVNELIKTETYDILNQTEAYTDSEINLLKTNIAIELNNLEIKLNNHILNADQNFKEFSKKLQDLDTKFSDQIEAMNTDFNNLRSEVISRLLSFESEFLAFKSDMINWRYNTAIELSDYFQKEFTRLELKLQNMNENMLFVTDPTTGEINTLKQTLQNIWNGFNIGGVSAGDYDNMQISAGEYDSLNVTADKYDHYGKFVFFDQIFGLNLQKQIDALKLKQKELLEYMKGYSNISGKKMPWYDMVYELVTTFHKEDALTASDYDTMNLLAGNYNGQQISAKEYDFYGRNVIKT